MTSDHFDALETRDPADREREFFGRLPDFIALASSAPGWAAHLAGIDPNAVTSPAELAKLPVLRKSDLAARQQEYPPFGGFNVTAPGRVRRLLMSPGPIFQPEGQGRDSWGAGRALLDELESQTEAIAASKTPEVNATSHQLAYNVIPGGWKPDADGYNEEEMKLVAETRKILHDPALHIAATCVRVPVPIGHSESVLIETGDKISASDARLILGEAPGIIVEDDPHAKLYPTPHDVAGKDEVYVGRIRDDISSSHGLMLWLVSDNLRKGAALNAVQIAEHALDMGVI